MTRTLPSPEAERPSPATQRHAARHSSGRRQPPPRAQVPYRFAGPQETRAMSNRPSPGPERPSRNRESATPLQRRTRRPEYPNQSKVAPQAPRHKHGESRQPRGCELRPWRAGEWSRACGCCEGPRETKHPQSRNRRLPCFSQHRAHQFGCRHSHKRETRKTRDRRERDAARVSPAQPLGVALDLRESRKQYRLQDPGERIDGSLHQISCAPIEAHCLRTQKPSDKQAITSESQIGCRPGHHPRRPKPEHSVGLLECPVQCDRVPHAPIQSRRLNPDFHFSFGSANHRVDSDAFIYAGLKALKALRRSTPNG